MMFFCSTYAKVTERGYATAYRFVARPDGEILGVEFLDFGTDKDFVEDGDIKEIEDSDWIDDLQDESRIDECRAAVCEYIKTTDQPEKVYGMSARHLPDWAIRFVSEDDVEGS